MSRSFEITEDAVYVQHSDGVLRKYNVEGELVPGFEISVNAPETPPDGNLLGRGLLPPLAFKPKDVCVTAERDGPDVTGNVRVVFKDVLLGIDLACTLDLATARSLFAHTGRSIEFIESNSDPS